MTWKFKKVYPMTVMNMYNSKSQNWPQFTIMVSKADRNQNCAK